MMSERVSTFCTKLHIFPHLHDVFGSKPMITRLGLVVLLCTSLSFAVILTFVPDLLAALGIWGTRLSIRGRAGSNLPHTEMSLPSKHNPTFHKHDLCSRNLAIQFPVQKLAQQLPESFEDSSLSLHTESQPKKPSKASDLDGEVMSALHLAKDMISHGKTERANKLFQHALALSPFHPDTLTEYGEFLEKVKNDVIEAEHHYCRALISSPQHNKALANRQRTLPLVEEIDQTYFNVIDRKLQVLLGIPENHPGVKRMMQESYYRHIYHTTAIEGNTFTLSQTRMLVENRLAIGGKSLMEHNEILGMEAAFKFINVSLINRVGSLAINDIKNIQKRVLGFVDPIGAGEFRTTQVFVGDYEPPEASIIPVLMDEYIEWINTEEALTLHPIELAAIAHYKLVWIHPFYDGNGRTSRLLMNLILMQAGYPPIIIHVEEKHLYYQYLETANNGDIRPFIRFIAKNTERAIDEYLLAGLEDARSLISDLRVQRDDGRTIILENDTEDQNYN